MQSQVGGMGMISTANYKARTFGVRSAMPGFIAVRESPFKNNKTGTCNNKIINSGQIVSASAIC